jgi:hypothetical protein
MQGGSDVSKKLILRGGESNRSIKKPPRQKRPGDAEQATVIAPMEKYSSLSRRSRSFIATRPFQPGPR